MEAEGKGSQIICLTWVKRNAAKLTPDQIGLSTEEFKQVIGGEEGKDDDQWSDITDKENDADGDTDEKSTEKKPGSDEDNYDDLKEFDMDKYDDEDENLPSRVSGLVMYADNDDDPYITKKKKSKEKKDEEEDEDSESEGEEEEKISTELRPDDNLLVCARCSEHSSILEVYVYNHQNGDFYVHHDIPLIEMPLCMQWIGFDPGAVGEDKGNLLAVGNFNSVVDIWDLDILNTLEPVFSIGQAKKKKKKKLEFEHTDAILDLAWSEKVKDKLASSSADTVVALWDLELGKATLTFKDHQNKVQTIEWKPDSSECLLSGAFDGRILELDVRSSKAGSQWTLEGEIERVVWNPLDSNRFVASNDSGIVYYLDRRKAGKILHQWAAHDESVPGLVFTETPTSKHSSSRISSSLLYTASSDGCVKVWDLNEKRATLVHERNMKMGMVHCCQGNPDETSVVAAGGQKDNVRLWDIKKTPEVLNYFGVKDTELDDVTSADTLEPEGGGGENDDDVIKYLEGEDYINEGRIKRLEKEAKKNENKIMNDRAKDAKGPGSKKKRKRKKKKENSVAPAIAPSAQVKADSNTVSVAPISANGNSAPKAQITSSTNNDTSLKPKKKKRKKKKQPQTKDGVDTELDSR